MCKLFDSFDLNCLRGCQKILLVRSLGCKKQLNSICNFMKFHNWYHTNAENIRLIQVKSESLTALRIILLYRHQNQIPFKIGLKIFASNAKQFDDVPSKLWNVSHTLHVLKIQKHHKLFFLLEFDLCWKLNHLSSFLMISAHCHDVKVPLQLNPKNRYKIIDFDSLKNPKKNLFGSIKAGFSF